jgi:hypothetical protein
LRGVRAALILVGGVAGEQPAPPGHYSEVPISEVNTTALVERLRRDNRRWKRLALGALALLVVALVVATALFAVHADRSAAALRAAEEARRAEQEARQDAERRWGDVERAHEQVQRILYARSIELAARELEQAGPKP